jgi:hypothetical protein
MSLFLAARHARRPPALVRSFFDYDRHWELHSGRIPSVAGALLVGIAATQLIMWLLALLHKRYLEFPGYANMALATPDHERWRKEIDGYPQNGRGGSAHRPRYAPRNGSDGGGFNGGAASYVDGAGFHPRGVAIDLPPRGAAVYGVGSPRGRPLSYQQAYPQPPQWGAPSPARPWRARDPERAGGSPARLGPGLAPRPPAALGGGRSIEL